MLRSKIFFLTLLALALPSLVSAQAVIIPESPQALSVRHTPEHPRPGDTIYFKADSLSYDVERSTFTWYINGTVYDSGIAHKEITAKAPGNGEALVISVVLIAPTGQKVTKNLTVRPSVVDLLWEAYSYTPPFYRGKGLASHNTLVKVAAFPDLRSPNGGFISPRDIVYTWSVDGTVIGSMSGLGKSTYIFRMPLLGETSNIKVEVSSRDYQAAGEASLVINSIEPEIHIYEDDPLIGPRFERSVNGRLTLAKNEVSLIGYPFFFSVDSVSDSKVKYNWRVNQLNSGDIDNKVVLRTPSGEKGRTEIQFKADNLKEIMQSASRAVEVLFGENEQSNNPFF